MSRRQTCTGVVVGTALAVVLAGCGSSSGGAATNPASSAGSSDAAATAVRARIAPYLKQPTETGVTKPPGQDTRHGGQCVLDRGEHRFDDSHYARLPQRRRSARVEADRAAVRPVGPTGSELGDAAGSPGRRGLHRRSGQTVSTLGQGLVAAKAAKAAKIPVLNSYGVGDSGGARTGSTPIRVDKSTPRRLARPWSTT